MKNKERNKYMLLLLILFGITLGYAIISTTLKINGTTNIGKNTWDVYWDNVANQNGVTTTTPIISNDATNGANTVVSWSVALNSPGDFYEFTIDAVNAGTLDAMVTTIEHKLGGNPMTSQNKLPNYVKYSVTYADGTAIRLNDILPKATVSGNITTNTRETYKIRVEYDSESLDNTDLSNEVETYEISFGLTYGQADSNARPKTEFILPSNRTGETLALGDKLCIDDQCFYFIKYDGDDAVLLSEWNLKVGNIYDSNGQKTGEYTNNDTGYGLQSSEARGMGSESPYNGVVFFSSDSYWTDNGIVTKPAYGGSMTGYIYDPTNYAGEPGTSTYSVAYYVEQYKTKLVNDYHGLIKEARLLTYEEITDQAIGCTKQNGVYTCPATGTNSFITQTSYWLGSCYADKIRYVNSNNNQVFYVDYNSNLLKYGVRPVIIVDKNAL